MQEHTMRFEKDDIGFHQWRNTHPDGYILNIAAASNYNAVIHASKCDEMGKLSYNAGTDNPSTNSFIKVCADTEAELDAWVNEHRPGAQPRHCKHCGGR